MKRARASMALAVAWVACGPVAAPPSSPIPINACPLHPCTAYVEPSPLAPPACSDGICATSSSIDFVFLVSAPDSSFYAPGQSFALQWSRLLAKPPTNASCTPPSCLSLDSLVPDSGSLVVSKAVATAPGIGENLNDGHGATLPVSVTYYPLWSDAAVNATTAATVFADAPSAGLPLLPIQGSITLQASATPGPNGSLAAVFGASLPTGTYERDVVPDDPAFPPVITDMVASSPPGSIEETSLDSPANHALTVTSSSNLAGFQAYVRDATTKRRLSSLTTFSARASSGVAYVNTYGALPPATGQAEIVIAPPAGDPMPTFTDPVVIAGPFAETYPALPSPVLVSGVVLDSNQAPVDADLIIDEATSTTGSILTAAGTENPHLHFESVVHATGGQYTVRLPPGTYDVWVAPSLESTAGAAGSVPLRIQALAGASPVAAGETLSAPAPGRIYGQVKVADTRLLAGATVSALPSASLAPTTDPRRWPRARSTVTADDGTFTLPVVDPGVYDVLVEPADGTSFPIVVASAQTVDVGGSLPLPTVVVGAPIAFDVHLRDPGNQPVIGALVRAFAIPSSFPTPVTGAPTPAVEIGHFVTDDEGRLQMLLLPPH